MYTITDLYDLSHTSAKDYLSAFVYPWEALDGLKEFLFSLGGKADKAEYAEISPGVWVHKTAKISSSALLCPPCIVGAGTEIRHGAFLRGSVLVGTDCVVGNSTELKNSILFDGVQTPHFNYVGDSVLGYRAHLGAGVVLSNVRSDKTPVVVKSREERLETGRRKVGGMIGDYAEIGCNSVLNPGTVVGRRSIVYPLSCVRGTVEEGSVYKTGGVVERRR